MGGLENMLEHLSVQIQVMFEYILNQDIQESRLEIRCWGICGYINCLLDAEIIDYDFADDLQSEIIRLSVHKADSHFWG